MIPHTENGYSVFDILSALQKDLRRGNEESALFWAMELAYSKTWKGNWTALVNQLKITIYENIGLADPELVRQIGQAIDDMVYIHDPKHCSRDEWDIILGHIIIMICRSPKSRVADHMKVYMKDEWKRVRDEWDIVAWGHLCGAVEDKPQIPDYAFDYHTGTGNRMGRKKSKGSVEDRLRGYNHFITEGEKLVNEVADLDIYKQKAHDVWKRRAELPEVTKNLRQFVTVKKVVCKQKEIKMEMI